MKRLDNNKYRWATLGEVCEKSQYGWTTSASKTGSIKLLRTTDITKGKINWETVPFCQDKPKDVDKYLLKNNDIVISRAGSIGESYILKNVEKSVFASYLIRFTLKNEVNPDYIAYFLKSPLYWNQVREASLGIAIPNINATKLNGFKLPLHERTVQEKIVEEIETQFTRLDAGVAALKRTQANLKRYRAAVLKAACEGKLVPTEAELAKNEGRSYETGEQLLQKILAERKKKWEAEQKKSGGRKKYVEPTLVEQGPQPYLPDGWTITSAESVFSSVRDGTHDTPAYIKEGVPLITSKNLLNNGIDFINIKKISKKDHVEISKRSGVAKGDILFAMIGTIGNPVVVETDEEFSIKNVGLFKNNPEFVMSHFMRYWFSSPYFIDWLKVKHKGSTQKFVPLGLLRALIVVLPPLNEQKRIIEELERRLSVTDKQEENINGKLKMAGNLRNAILSNLFRMVA